MCTIFYKYYTHEIPLNVHNNIEKMLSMCICSYLRHRGNKCDRLPSIPFTSDLQGLSPYKHIHKSANKNSLNYCTNILL